VPSTPPPARNALPAPLQPLGRAPGGSRAQAAPVPPRNAGCPLSKPCAPRLQHPVSREGENARPRGSSWPSDSRCGLLPFLKSPRETAHELLLLRAGAAQRRRSSIHDSPSSAFLCYSGSVRLFSSLFFPSCFKYFISFHSPFPSPALPREGQAPREGLSRCERGSSTPQAEAVPKITRARGPATRSAGAGTASRPPVQERAAGTRQLSHPAG